MITDGVIYVDAYYYITQNDLQKLLYSVHDMHYIYNIQSLYICLGSRVIGHQYFYLCALVGPFTYFANRVSAPSSLPKKYMSPYSIPCLNVPPSKINGIPIDPRTKI